MQETETTREELSEILAEVCGEDLELFARIFRNGGKAYEKVDTFRGILEKKQF